MTLGCIAACISAVSVPARPPEREKEQSEYANNKACNRTSLYLALTDFC